jgi:predicted nucleic acid-binding protein
MGFLIETSILARLANVKDAQHAVAARAVLELHRRGEVLHVTPQVMVEFRNVATRPVTVNGLVLSASRCMTPALLPSAMFMR